MVRNLKQCYILNLGKIASMNSLRRHNTPILLFENLVRALFHNKADFDRHLSKIIVN